MFQSKRCDVSLQKVGSPGHPAFLEEVHTEVAGATLHGGLAKLPRSTPPRCGDEVLGQ